MMSRPLCKICDNKTAVCFETVVLSKYPATMHHCQGCGFLALDDPVWLEEAYSSSIALSDTGLVMRNLSLSRQLTPLLFHVFGAHGTYADFAGGTGLLVRLMRDTGFDFFWHDLYCENVHARGFEYSAERGPCKAVTAFEVLEHVLDPVGFVDETIRQTQADMFIFSTELYYGVPPKPEDWWYYSLDTGQHLSFFQKKTLRFIADRLNLEFYSFGMFHIFSQKKHSKPLLRYVNSSLIRNISKLKVRLVLSSRVMSDNRHMLNRIRSFENNT